MFYFAIKNDISYAVERLYIIQIYRFDSNLQAQNVFSIIVALSMAFVLFQNCIFDACAFGDSKSSVEDNVATYAKTCQDLGLQICRNWREEANIRELIISVKIKGFSTSNYLQSKTFEISCDQS